MKITQLQPFKEHTKKTRVPVYLLISKDLYDREEALKYILDISRAITIFEGERLYPQILLQEIETLSFLEEHKTVVIKDIEKLPAQTSTALKEYLESPADTVSVVLTTCSLPSNSKILKLSDKHGIVLNIADMKLWEKKKYLASWVRDIVKKENKTIDVATSTRMIDRIGIDKHILRNEIDKLICYVDTRNTIKAQDIEDICCTTNTETIWQWRDAIFSRNTSAALRIGKKMLESGSAIQGLLAQLRTQLQTGYYLSSTIETGGTRDSITKAFPYMRGNILERNISSSSSYGSNSFRKGLIAIHNTDLKSKTIDVSHELLLETLMIKLTR